MEVLLRQRLAFDCIVAAVRNRKAAIAAALAAKEADAAARTGNPAADGERRSTGAVGGLAREL
jgi:hypothetical protein